jgi:D-hexose-6-phosphate mutarotase
MEIEIQNDNTKAIIDPHGAWLTNLSNEYGDIIFPKRNLTGEDGSVKQRGGSHVCLPNFGPGGTSGQPQHGFGRVVDWELTDKTNSSVLLTLKKGEGDYGEMESVLAYQLGDDRLVMTLEVVNNGSTDLRVAPAFHPYFALTDEADVAIDGEKEPLENLAEAQFVSGTIHTLDAAGRTLTLTSDALQSWAKWTDRLGKYVCVEPSVGGFTFLKDTPEAGEMLRPGESKTYSFTISWA